MKLCAMRNGEPVSEDRVDVAGPAFSAFAELLGYPPHVYPDEFDPDELQRRIRSLDAGSAGRVERFLRLPRNYFRTKGSELRELCRIAQESGGIISFV